VNALKSAKLPAVILGTVTIEFTFTPLLKSFLQKALAGPAIAMHLCVLLWSPEVLPQSPVLQFTANYVSAASSLSSYTSFPTSPGSFSACTGNNYTYSWSNGTNNQLKLISFTANSKTYVVAGTPGVEVKLRRVNNAVVTGNRNILYSETTFASATSCITPRQLDFKAPYNDDMALFLNNNVLNHGTDNLFTNASNGDANNNNIERVDVVFTTGISTTLPADAGFVLCERGSNNAHDGFRIAAITGIDASNNPTSFGAVKTCVAGNGSSNGSWGHPSIANGNRQLAAYVLRKDPADTYLRVSSHVNQELGGVFFSLAELGVAESQIIFGYCLIGPDGTANPSSAQLLNTSDAAVYPTGTTEVMGGGLDLISINTFYGTSQVLANSIVQSFRGYVQASEARIYWTLNSIATGTIIHLERSKDAVSFTTAYTYLQDGIPDKSYTDTPGAGLFYYRLRIENAGAIVYSSIVQLLVGSKQTGWKIYPTLIRPGETITVDNIATGLYTASLQNSVLAVVHRSIFYVRNGKGTILLSQKRLAAGTYFLVIEKEGTPLYGRVRIIVQNQ